MLKQFVFVTGALDILIGIAAAAPALLDPQPETFVPFLALGAFLLFAGAALMWSAQDLAIRAPIVFWQGLVRLVAVVSTVYAINTGLAEAELYAVAVFDGVICAVYFVGLTRLTGASPLMLLVGRTA
jgi:hypothetical protein